jgi:hypothetical protein
MCRSAPRACSGSGSRTSSVLGAERLLRSCVSTSCSTDPSCPTPTRSEFQAAIAGLVPTLNGRTSAACEQRSCCSRFAHGRRTNTSPVVPGSLNNRYLSESVGIRRDDQRGFQDRRLQPLGHLSKERNPFVHAGPDRIRSPPEPTRRGIWSHLVTETCPPPA